MEKAYAHDSAALVCDVLRCMLEVDDLEKAGAALRKIATAPELVVCRVKERFVQAPTTGGWRDCLINARFADDSHVFEVQVVQRPSGIEARWS